MSALSQVKQAPEYLRPEATRPLAVPVHRGGRSLGASFLTIITSQASSIGMTKDRWSQKCTTSASGKLQSSPEYACLSAMRVTMLSEAAGTLPLLNCWLSD